MEYDGKNRCFLCGHEVGWDSSEMASDVSGLPEDDTSVVNFYTCPYCGAFHEVYECSDEEKSSYDYWKEKEEKK